MFTSADAIGNACRAGLVVPAFNVPYLPMVEPVIQAVVDQDAFALIETARLEWTKFESQGPAAVMEEFVKWNQPDHVRIHLDHVPVIDEDNLAVDYLPIIQGNRSRGNIPDVLSGNHSVPWEQGWGLLAPISCITSFGEVIQYITMLLFQRSDDRHDTFSKSTSGLALSAEAVLAPKHAGTDLSFTQVVGRFDAFDVHECPQGILSFEDVAASACGFTMVAGRTLAK